MKKLKVTQVKSVIESKEVFKRTIKALGLGRPNYSVIVSDTPTIRGMVRRVRHLVTVEELKG